MSGVAVRQAAKDVASAPQTKIGASVTIRHLTKSYGATPVINGIDIDIAAGEFVTLLGPSGSGKTTTIMAIAGFVEGYDGIIRIGDRAIDGLPAHHRDVGIVFQHLALFPHMTVRDNVAFPLRMRGASKADIEKRVADTLALVRLERFGDRLPAQLSGGQQQRVALARALVFDPPVLLLDEPMGALDRKLRDNLQLELKLLHQRLGITIIHVTHDQSEALAMSDRVAVMDGGRIAQFDTPGEIYRNPADRFVAEFVGDASFLDGTLAVDKADRPCVVTRGGLSLPLRIDAPIAPGAKLTLMLRPEHVAIGARAEGLPDAVDAEVVDRTFTGDRSRYWLRLPGEEMILADVPNSADATEYEVGHTTKAVWSAAHALVFFGDGSRA
ncbi:MAG: ABC transporter ATP-binding protein [Proteobacteria bacterium]|nr:ABC transporter ATP-binding protein [Pseudomonadota bacterium]